MLGRAGAMDTSSEAVTNDRTDLQKALNLSQAINTQSWREPDLASLSDGLYDLFDCFVWGVLIADRAKPKLDLFPLTRLSSQAALASIQEKVWAARTSGRNSQRHGASGKSDLRPKSGCRCPDGSLELLGVGASGQGLIGSDHLRPA